MSNATAVIRRSQAWAGGIGLFCLGLAWIIPNKIYPWVSFWNESVAALAVLLLGCFAWRSRAATQYALAWPWAALLGLGIATAWAQWALGLLTYAGDAWLLTLYLSLLALAIVTGYALSSSAQGLYWQKSFLLLCLAAGVCTAGAALVQWLWAHPPVIFLMELEIADRPYANLGQPNHTSTLLFLAICSTLQLQHERAIGRLAACITLILLTSAMVLTQSRTGVLQWGMLLVYSLWVRRRGYPLAWRWSLFVVLIGLLGWRLLPWLSKTLLLPSHPRLMTASGGSGRLELWHAFFDAVSLRPWSGWGWLQTGWAQQEVAACSPNIGVYFSYTHLLPLDFFLWLGLPLGFLFCALLIWWIAPYLTRVGSATAGYWLVAVLAVCIHALLEYPYAYMYFLLPIGLMIGILTARVPIQHTLHLPAKFFIGLWVVCTTLALSIFDDALRASHSYSEVRFAEARIGNSVKPPQVPQLRLLNQLQALVELRATEVERPPNPMTLNAAGEVARRLPLRWVSQRYAQLLALADKPDEAAREQQRFCDINGEQQCWLSGMRWEQWRGTQSREMPAFQAATRSVRCEAAK